uniref:Secreted protein n=1 Tax=Sipha flava TaxID=143950 RepID=A0A2S2PWF4_9HEMI
MFFIFWTILLFFLIVQLVNISTGGERYKEMPNKRLISNYKHLQCQQRIPVHSSLLYRSHRRHYNGQLSPGPIYKYIGCRASFFESSLFLIAADTLCIFSTTQSTYYKYATYYYHYYCYYY